MPQIMSIGKLSGASGVKVPTIRYYEQIGLLSAAPRTQSNRRMYGTAEARRLIFIRHARELGFEVDAIRSLLRLQDKPRQSCAAVDVIAKARLQEVERRIESLKALRGELKRMVEGCRQGHIAECRVLEVLADHGQCLHRDHRKGQS